MSEDSENIDEEEAPKKSPVIWIVIGVILLVLIAGGGYVGMRLLKNDNQADSPKDTPKKSDKTAQQFEESKFHKMDPFIVNLSDQGRKHYLSANIELEYMDSDTEAELKTRTPQLRDAILLMLSSKSTADIEGVDGKIALKNELIMKINQILKQGKIKNLYFTQFVIQ